MWLLNPSWFHPGRQGRMEQGGERRERLLRAGREHPGRDGGESKCPVHLEGGRPAIEVRTEGLGGPGSGVPHSRGDGERRQAGGPRLAIAGAASAFSARGRGLQASGVQCKCCRVRGCGTCLRKHVFSTAGRGLRDQLGPSLLLTEKETEAQGDGTDVGGGSRPGSAPAQHVPQQAPASPLSPFPLA